MKIRMTLLSDTIFGNGVSVPGAEDISILCDEQGFPYYKGGTFKGIFREELERYLELNGEDLSQSIVKVRSLLGEAGDHDDSGKLVFSDFRISPKVREAVLSETTDPAVITDLMTHLRTFTAIDENGAVKTGSLRIARCANKGLSFYGEIACPEGEKELVKQVLEMIKWIGSMRNRGFGKISLSEEV